MFNIIDIVNKKDIYKEKLPILNLYYILEVYL